MNPELQVQVSKPLMFTQVALLLATKINNINTPVEPSTRDKLRTGLSSFVKRLPI